MHNSKNKRHSSALEVTAAPNRRRPNGGAHLSRCP